MMRTVPILFLAGLVLLGCEQHPATQPATPSQAVRLIHTWGIDTAGADRMQTALNKALTGLRVELTRSVSATAVQMLQRDEIDAAFTYANIAYMASSGQLLKMTEPNDHIRAIAELPSRAVQIIVGPHSGVTSIRALRGRHVSLGAPGGSAAPVAELVLRAHGITLSDLRAERLELSEAAHKIMTGELDAVFSYDSTSADIAEAVRQGARILEVVGSEIDEVRTTYPLLEPTVIPAGTYPPLNHVIRTVGIDGIFICRTNLDDNIVYQLTRALVEVVSHGDLGIEALKHMNLSAASSTAIPLHYGAARYYRERELLP